MFCKTDVCWALSVLFRGINTTSMPPFEEKFIYPYCILYSNGVLPRKRLHFFLVEREPFVYWVWSCSKSRM
jgi:hypothetical protein